MTVNRLLNLPWRLSKEQISWLKNRMKDKRLEVRALAKRTIRDEVSSEAVRGHRGRFYRIAKAVCIMQAVSFLRKETLLWQPHASCPCISERGALRAEQSAILLIMWQIRKMTDTENLITGYGCDSRTPMQSFCWRSGSISPPPDECAARMM